MDLVPKIHDDNYNMVTTSKSLVTNSLTLSSLGKCHSLEGVVLPPIDCVEWALCSFEI